MDSTSAKPIPAKVILGGMAGLAAWKLLGPQTRQKIVQCLDSLFEAAEQRKQQEERERLNAIFYAAWANYLKSLNPPSSNERSSQPSLLKETPQDASPPGKHQSPVATTELEPDSGWQSVIVHPSVILILGKRGSGKSALAWEEEHGIPADNGLTGIHQRIHCSPPEDYQGGDGYDPYNPDEPI